MVLCAAVISVVPKQVFLKWIFWKAFKSLKISVHDHCLGTSSQQEKAADMTRVWTEGNLQVPWKNNEEATKTREQEWKKQTGKPKESGKEKKKQRSREYTHTIYFQKMLSIPLSHTWTTCIATLLREPVNTS